MVAFCPSQIKSARNFVEQEQKVRFQAEKERDLLQKQILVIKDFLLADGGKTINNETLEQIKKIDVSGFTSAKPGKKSGFWVLTRKVGFI
jgi:hypothetical protein